MQSKGAVKLLAILLALVCLYQLSFTFITRGVENDAKEFAKGDEQKERNYLEAEKIFLNLLNKDYFIIHFIR